MLILKRNYSLFYCISLCVIIISCPFVYSLGAEDIDSLHSSQMIDTFNCVIISDEDPYFGIIGACYACRYGSDAENVLLPMLICQDNFYSEKQNRFLENYTDHPKSLIIGEIDNVSIDHISYSSSPVDIAIDLALASFTTSNAALILPYSSYESYELSVIASPLSSFLNIPVLFFDNNTDQINGVLVALQVEQVYVVGAINESWSAEEQIRLSSSKEIWKLQLGILKERLKKTDYIILTNPSDVLPIQVRNTSKRYIKEYINHTSLTIFGKTISISGNNSIVFNFTVPDGINDVNVFAQITDNHGLLDQFEDINPIISIKILNEFDQVVSYASSPAVDMKQVKTDTLICNASGPYSIFLKVYHGIKGGYFSARGFSSVKTSINVTITINELNNSHRPLVPNLSMLAPYLASVHAGVIVADDSFALTASGYETVASNTSAGPWYDESLHEYNNKKVNTTIQHLDELLLLMQHEEMLYSYLNGPSWLAILADTNMVPMYYYAPSQPSLLEKGLPSDNPYSLDQCLSTGRILAPSVSDASLLLCRTFFYETLCGTPHAEDPWFHSFHFIFGEGFGETGGLFHQIPYAQEITEYGFTPKVYGDFRNSRQFAEKNNVYSNTNYIEYLGHGDWYWFTPSLYGFDMYSKAIDVAHVNDWVFDRPSVFLTSACLMGRVDGISADMNIGLSFLAAGSNAFIGATRLTGQEAGLETIENALIISDMSMGEAVRMEKRTDTEMPTFVVRTLFGDPAFNPFEPNNGFSNQGIPMIK